MSSKFSGAFEIYIYVNAPVALLGIVVLARVPCDGKGFQREGKNLASVVTGSEKVSYLKPRT